ncbi:unnamed protein product [Eruca vesicaria subsp. sativa]|uniref:SBP-type domain-containing protein n=1 Tax=Eruca vesicaria subsp. sativa TaxID=29727 RepID=A0ABC8M5E2_ERUVS|nr:unnamed protein product [Eruca vesicaria subsp. sativa]
MDWNFKLRSGYFSEFDQESVPDLTPIDASISFGGSPRLQPKGDFSFDLKLGRNIGHSSSSSSAFGNAEQVISLSKLKESASEASRNSSGSSKRTRGNNNQIPICLVDGCDSDFSNCREYHKRHKVCDVHSKTPVVTISGHKQRFCQQCSRFHALEEFDEGKRSCRKRLDGHNRRRRKPQPDHIGRPATFFQGSKLLDFSSSPHVFPTTSVGSPSWGNGLVSVAMANGSSYGQNQSYAGSCPAKTCTIFPTSSSPNSRGKHFPFLQEEDSSRTASLCERMTSCIHDSDCALSLLSSSSSSVPHLLQAPLSLSQETVFYGSGLFENASAVSDGSGNEAVALPQTFPFHWE